MERVKITNGFKKGHAKVGGRQKGTPNRMTILLKHGIEQSLQVKGDHLAEKAEENPDRYGEYAVGGVIAGLLWLMNKEPSAYTNLVARLLPMQLQGKLEGEINHRYETVEEVAQALKERGLPPPSKIIDITPRLVSSRPIEDEDDEEAIAS